jgi:hypothetical protein
MATDIFNTPCWAEEQPWFRTNHSAVWSVVKAKKHLSPFKQIVAQQIGAIGPTIEQHYFACNCASLKTIGQKNSGTGISGNGIVKTKRGVPLPRFLCLRVVALEDHWAREFGHGNFRKWSC